MANENDLNINPTRQDARIFSRAERRDDTSSDVLESRLGEGRQEEDGHDDVIDTLNNLLECCHDGEYGFRACAEHIESRELQSQLSRRAESCKAAADELQALIEQMGGDAESGGSASGALHRGWVSVKGTLSGYSDYAMMDECERGEDVALAQYRKALKQDLTPEARLLVERQARGVQINHDEIKAMRDAIKENR